MWIDKPDKPGYWLFKGIRTSRSRGFLAHIAAPVHVKEEKAYPELIVYYTGSGAVYGITQHEGLWFYLGDMLDDTQ